MPKISVVIPVYYGVPTVERLVGRLVKSLKTVTEDFEIILVNDFSPDGSWDLIKRISNQTLEVNGINLSRNFGQHYAIAAGLARALGDWIVVMDCDLQDRPEEIPKLFETAVQGNYDLVVAKRKSRQDNFIKILGSRFFYFLLSWLTGVRQDPEVANFGIYKKKVIEEINKLPENFRYFPVMVRWLGFNRGTLEVEHAARDAGSSTYNFRKLLRLAFEIIIAFSDKPLRLAIVLGSAVSLFAFAMGVWILIKALGGSYSIRGWPSLMISVWFLSGIIMSLLGIVGIYVGRTYREAKRRPIFIISEET